MKFTAFPFWHVCAVFVSILLVGCGGSTGDASGSGAAEGETIKLAVCAPMTGAAAAFGDMIKKGAELMAKEANASGGVSGKQIELVFHDDQGNPKEASNIARKIAADESITAVIGHFNSVCSNAAKAEYNRRGVLQFSPGSTNVLVCKGSPWTFRNLYRDDYQGIFLAQYAQKVLGIKNVAVFFENDDYGKGLKQAFVQEAQKIGLAMAGEESFVRERTLDFKPLVSKFKGKNIDGIFIAGLYGEAAQVTKAAIVDLQLDVKVLAGDGVMDNKFIELATAKAAEGAYITTPFLLNTGSDSPQASAFQGAFKAEYGQDANTWAALTYDAVGMAITGLQEVGADRKALRDWMASITDKERGYVGVTGVTYFDAEGDCYSKGASVATVRDGQFVPAEEQMAPE